VTILRYQSSINLIVLLYIHTPKIAGRILNSRTERKNEDVLGEDQSGLRRGKETRDATGMLRI
jgi:hypothetical protein